MGNCQFGKLFRLVSSSLYILLAALMLSSCSRDRIIADATPPDIEPRVHGLFSDHALLQQHTPVPVWGWDLPGTPVRVEFRDDVRRTTAGDDGRWQVELDPQQPGGPDLLHIYGSREWVFSDILVGEVWLCSGQSNMQWPLNWSAGPEQAVAAADWPEIRLYSVPREASWTPRDDVGGKWLVCSPETVAEFSAVGYYFGRDIHQDIGVPVGLINSSWGGTRAESWTSRAGLAQSPLYTDAINRADRLATPEGFAEFHAEKLAEYEQWFAATFPPSPPDRGLTAGWAEPGFDDSSWPVMLIPGLWENAGLNIDGMVWLRREIEIPPEWNNLELELSLGRIDDYDETYFNGVEIGRTGIETPNFWLARRVYTIPAGGARPGANVVAVRVTDRLAGGGMHSEPADYYIRPKSQPDAKPLPLTGEWRYAVEIEVSPDHSWPPELPTNPAGNWREPMNLYNGMIAPLVPYAFQGVIWYQGESNAGEAKAYRTLFPLMIEDWRAKWQRQFPFLFVQLAPFGKADNPRSGWALLREAQSMTAACVPDTAMVVITDVGNCADIHPKDKVTVGHRLALAARALVYDQDVTWESPRFDWWSIEGGKAIVRFMAVADGLRIDGEKSLGFQIAGEDRVFHPAEAEVNGDIVTVQSILVPSPVAVRYAWSDCPEANLANSAGLPASPFRTDDWDDATEAPNP